MVSLKVIKSETNKAFNNSLYLNGIHKSNIGLYASVNEYIYSVVYDDNIDTDSVMINVVCRIALNAILGQNINITSANHAHDIKSIKQLCFAIDKYTKHKDEVKLNYNTLKKIITTDLLNQIMIPKQKIVINYNGSLYYINVDVMNDITDELEIIEMSQGKISISTEIYFTSPKDIIIENNKLLAKRNNIFKKDIDLNKLGIGGLNNEFSQIFRRAFASRILPSDIIDKLEIQHVKGLLLYGPPGTGKTLIARGISKLLGCENIQVIAGPSLLDKFVGESERKLRELFAPAEKEQSEKGSESSLHVLIFDEIDSLFKQRGGSQSSLSDGLTNQLLSKMDGPDRLNNILIIGMTNRKDLLDDAVLRPGRFEVHIEITLPDLNGRTQILNIHTNKLKNNNFIDDNVNINDIAIKTKNYTGAELEAVVRSAFSLAQARVTDMNTLNKKNNFDNLKITNSDFNVALIENKPKFGVSEMPNYEIYTLESGWYIDIINAFNIIKNKLGTSTMLLHGPVGSGKTALACHLAKLTECVYIKYIKPKQFIGDSEQSISSKLKDIFVDSTKSQESIIIIDDIELLIGYNEVGCRYSSIILNTLKSLLKDNTNDKLLVIGLTNNYEALKNLSFSSYFSIKKSIGAICIEDILSIAKNLNCNIGDELMFNKYNQCLLIKDVIAYLNYANTIAYKLNNNIINGKIFDDVVNMH